MRDESFDVTATSEQTSSENYHTNTNYSRWMSDMAADIAHLKLHQLAIPGAHNSGVDADGKDLLGNPWAICQYNDFSSQLNAGARYLDLRLVDSSYNKDIGGKKPTYQFKEIFEFKHGVISVGRRLQHLVSAVDNFTTDNPGEIVIIDFHHYDRGNYSHNSLQRCLPYFNSIKNRLIPPAAKGLSIGEIKQNHPGRNIILCLDHNYPKPVSEGGKPPQPDKWAGEVVQRDQIWSTLSHVWTADATEDNVTSLVANSMTSPPQNAYWVLSAAAGSPPKDLHPDHPIRTEVFKSGFQNANIVMVDFINGDNARTSVVDKCITLNRLRGVDKSSPTAPTNLVVISKDSEYDDNGHFKVNTLEFSWNPSADNLGVRGYEIYTNDQLFATTSNSPYEHKNFHLKNYSFTAKGIDILNNRSDNSNRVEFIQDIVHPTMPPYIRTSSITTDSANIFWSNSFDAAGIKGYEVYLENEILDFVPYADYPNIIIDSLTQSKKYNISVRAVDINDLRSEFNTKVIPPRPVLINPKVSICTYDENTKMYDGNVIWETDIERTETINYHAHSGSGWQSYFYEPGDTISFAFQATQGQRITHVTAVYYDLTPGSSPSISPSHHFILDATPPAPPTNLNLTHSTPNGASISWTPSTNGNPTNYAISINEESPILVPSSVNTYTFEEGSLKEKALIDIWAINDVDVPSPLESIIFEPVDVTPPDKPGTPIVSAVFPTSATVTWTASTDNVGIKCYEVIVNGETPIPVVQSTHSLSNLKDATLYTVEIVAVDTAGNRSEPSRQTFLTPPNEPGTPVISNLTGNSATLTWPGSEGSQVRYSVSLNGFLIALTNQAQFTITHLRTLTDYCAEIRAFNDAGISEPAMLEFKTLLSPPANLSFSHRNGRCRLAWNVVFGKFPSHEVSINGKIFTTEPGRFGYSFKLSELSPGPAPHRFTFKVRAQLDGHSSEESQLEETLIDDVPPTQPGAPIASDITDKGVTLTWEPASDNVGVTQYRVVLNGLLVFPTRNTHYTFTDLISGAYHHVVVRAQDEDGNLSPPSKRTVFKTTGENPFPPPPAPSVRVTDETATSLKLEWDALNGAAGVRISLNDEHWRDILLLPGVIIPNLFPSVEYAISVSVFDIYGQLSEPTVITHELKDVTPPSVPGNLRESTSTSDSVTLTWAASTDDIGICDYVIYNNHEYFDRTPLTHYSAIGLMPGTYTFEVIALDLSGNPSEPASIIVEIKDETSST